MANGYAEIISQLRHKGLGGSSAIRSAVNNICGVGAPLCNSTLLQPWMPITQHFHTLPYMTSSFRSGNASRFRVRDLVIRGEDVDRVLTGPTAPSVFGSLVCSSFLQDSEASVVFSGYGVRSDGIVATSTNCLRGLKDTEYKIGVKILGRPSTCRGVLVHADFHSKIAFVKILGWSTTRTKRWKVGLSVCGEGDEVVAMGWNPVYPNWRNVRCGYSRGWFRSIEDDMETNSLSQCNDIWPVNKSVMFYSKIFHRGGSTRGLDGGVLGVIHGARGPEFKPHDVLKYLEYFEKHGKIIQGVSF